MNIFNKERNLTPAWDILGPSVDLVKKYIQPLIYLAVLPQCVLVLASVLLQSKIHSPLTTREFYGLVALVVGLIWTLLTYAGYIFFTTQTAQGKNVGTLEAIKYGLTRTLPMIGASLVSGFLTVLGFIFFIIPGLILLRAFYLAPYYVVNEKLGPIAALKKSAAESKPVSAWVWGTIGVTAALALISGVAGVIPFLGIILSVVITFIYAYGPTIRYCEIAKLKTVDLKR